MDHTSSQVSKTIFSWMCIAHDSSTCKGVVPWINLLQISCKNLVKFFKRRHKLWYEIRARQERDGLCRLVLPAETRWGRIERCFSSIVKSEQILPAMVSSRDFLKDNTKKKKEKRLQIQEFVRSKATVPRLNLAIEILDFLSKWQKIFERNTTPVSEVYHMSLL